MRSRFHRAQLPVILALLVSLSLVLSACNLTPTEQSPSPNVPKAAENASAVTVAYSYGATGSVQLSANPVILKVGQKLILEPGAGTTGRTRFVSSGASYVGAILQQETDPSITTRVIFTAVKPGTGELQVIPNMTETERATTLTITVK